MLPLILEAARCFEDGVTASPGEADMCLILGLGLPRYLGGALKYADYLGLRTVVERAAKWESLGAIYEPSEKLLALAASGKGLLFRVSRRGLRLKPAIQFCRRDRSGFAALILAGMSLLFRNGSQIQLSPARPDAKSSGALNPALRRPARRRRWRTRSGCAGFHDEPGRGRRAGERCAIRYLARACSRPDGAGSLAHDPGSARLRRPGGVLPEVAALFGVPQIADDPPLVDLGDHLLRALNEAARRNEPLPVRFALLVMNVGKVDLPPEHLPVHYRHIDRGGPRIEAICDRFNAPRDCRDLALQALAECERVHRTSEARAGPVALMLERLGAFDAPDFFALLMEVCACDYCAYGERAGAAYPKAKLLEAAFKACTGS